MGGQNSKLTPEGEAVPPRIRSLLQRRFEEIKIRTKARKLKASNLSKKQLLKDGDQAEIDNSLTHSLLSSPDNFACPKTTTTLEKNSKVAPIVPELDKETKQTKELDDDQNKEQIKRDGTECRVEDQKEAKGVNVYVGGVFALEETTEGEEEDEDNEHNIWRNSEIYLCPASPSFRVYCMDTLEIENDDSKNASIDEDTKHKKSPSAESAGSSVDSVASDKDDGLETKPKKKGGRRRKIKNALSMGGSANAVKNLLNVKGCYNPGCTGHDRSAYLAEKSAAT